MSARHSAVENPLHPSTFNGYTTGWGGVSWGIFGRFGGGRCREPVGVSKAPSTFVRQFDRFGTLSAGRQAPCAQTSRLRSLSLFVRSFAGLPVSLQRLVPSPHHPSVAAALYLSLTRSSRAPWSPLLASLSSFLSSCPPPARHSVRS
jgi:hypothetical protein